MTEERKDYTGGYLMIAILGVVIMSLLAGRADAQEGATWTVLPLKARSVEGDATEIFRELLQSELASRNNARFVAPNQSDPCSDNSCAISAAKAVNAEFALYGAVSGLGSSIIAQITVVDAGSGQVVSSQKMVVDRIEDLEAVAGRMTSAIVNGTSTDETAQLGQVTEKEREVDVRREGDSGLGLRVGVVSPISGYDQSQFGSLIDISYWYETRDFAIEPRLGFRFDNAVEDEAGYSEWGMDLGAYYILSRSDFAPFIGGGFGLHNLTETRQYKETQGSIIPTTITNEVEDNVWGAAAFARAGILLFRTYSVRVAMTAEYNAMFVEINNRSVPQSLTFGAAVYF